MAGTYQPPVKMVGILGMNMTRRENLLNALGLKTAMKSEPSRVVAQLLTEADQGLVFGAGARFANGDYSQSGGNFTQTSGNHTQTGDGNYTMGTKIIQ